MSATQIVETGLTQTGAGTRLKVCGITARAEIDLLAAHGVDFVGLWWGVPGGPHDLDRTRWRESAEAAADADGLTPVLVTFAKDADELRETLEGTRRALDPAPRLPNPGHDPQAQGDRGRRGIQSG